FCRCDLRDRRSLDEIFSLILQRCGPVSQQARRVQTHSHLGKLVLYLLKLDQRLLKTDSGLCVAHSSLVRGLTNPDALCCDVYPASVVGLDSYIEAITLFSQQVVLGNLHMVKN